jgi:hypothetical protein
VQVLEQQEQRLHLAFAQQHVLEPVERALAALRRVQVQKGTVRRRGIQEGEQRWDGLLEGLVQRQHLPGDLGADGASVVGALQVAVAPQQVKHREIGRRLAIGHRGALQHPPALRVMGMDAFVH